MDESGTEGVITPDMAESMGEVDPQELAELRAAFGDDSGPVSGLDSSEDSYDDEVPDFVLNMGKGNSGNMNQRDLAKLQNLQGKTLMAMIAILEAQKADPEAYQMFIDAEGTFSATWAKTLGLNTDRIIVIDGEMAVNGRKCFEMLLGEPKEDKKTHKLAGKSKEGLLDQIVKGEININLIVLDSLGSIMPPGEDTSAVGKMNMSLLARADSKILDSKENKIGHTTRATIEKSKFGPWPRKCEFKVNFAIGIVNREDEIAALALDYNVVQKPTTVTHQYGERKWVGLAKFVEAIATDEALAAELVEKISTARETKNDKERASQDGDVEETEDDLPEASE
ncbi:unnamed protein product [Sphagnum balticum]